MAIRIPSERAEELLAVALQLSKEADQLPVDWISHSRAVFQFDSMTYTPALGTILLAKAVNERVDAFSIKAAGPRAYSMRSLAHNVLVPAARSEGFSIRNKGREPLNNQPFFRYDRIDRIERVRQPKELQYFVSIADAAERLSSAQALYALAAFLKVATDEANRVHSVIVKASGLDTDHLRAACSDFLRPTAAERPRRLQAFAAACLDLVHRDVQTRRLNDPSRDSPGDVQVLRGGRVVTALEVRGKAVRNSDIVTFTESCAAHGIGRAIMLIDLESAKDRETGAVGAKTMGLATLRVYHHALDLLIEAISWSELPYYEATLSFSRNLLVRLEDIGVRTSGQEEWARAISVAAASQ